MIVRSSRAQRAAGRRSPRRARATASSAARRGPPRRPRRSARCARSQRLARHRAPRPSPAAPPAPGRSSASTTSWWPCGDHSSVGRSVTTSGSAIVSRSSRWRSPSSTTTVSRSSASSPGARVAFGGDRHARVQALAAAARRTSTSSARGVVAADAAQAVGDLAAPLAVDERDHVQHPRRARSCSFSAWRSTSSPRSAASIASGVVPCVAPDARR